MTRRLLLVTLALLASVPSWAAEKDSIVAVMSSQMEPYEQALEGFRRAARQTPRVVYLHKEPLKLFGQPDVILAFGGKAAMLSYPPGTAVVICMAPGTDAGPTAAKISMMPSPSATLSAIRAMQSSVKRVSVLWISPTFSSYLQDFKKAGRDLGIEVHGDRLADAHALPERLRAAAGSSDAIWLPADPLLLSQQNLVLLSQFSSSARVPLYSGVAGLLDRGALATFSVDYREIGKSAGDASNRITIGGAVAGDVYPDVYVTGVNLKTAQSLGMKVDDRTVERAGKVVR